MQIFITKYTLVLYTMHSRHCKGVQEQIVSEAIRCVSWGRRRSTVSNSSLEFNHIASWIYETDQLQTAINLMVVSLTNIVRRFRSSPSHDRTRNQIKNYVVPNRVGTMYTVNSVGNKLSTKGMIIIVVPGSVEPNTSLV